MKKAIPLILVAAGVAAALYFRNAKDFLAAYTVRVGRIAFNMADTQAAGFLRVVLDVNLVLSNPSNFTGMINGVKLDLLYGGRIVAGVNKTDALKINAGTSTVVPFKVSISTLSLFSNLQAAYQALVNKQAIVLTVVGSVLTNSGTINVNERINVA